MKLLYQLPTNGTALAIDDLGRMAVTCSNGNVYLFNADGAFLTMLDVSPGTIDQDRRAVAYRLDVLAVADFGEWAIAVRDDKTLCRVSDVPSTRTVRGISRRGWFAVADDRFAYNLRTGRNWQMAWLTGDSNDWMFCPPCVAEDDNETLWTGGPDGHVRRWTSDGYALGDTLIADSQGINSIDVNSQRVVASGWDRKLTVLDKSGAILFQTSELSLVRGVRFHPDGRIVYVTSDGRVCQWDGNSHVLASTPAPAPQPSPTKPGKRRK